VLKNGIRPNPALEAHPYHPFNVLREEGGWDCSWDDRGIQQKEAIKMELLQMLTQQLGVSEDQAKGGTGLLLKLAKEKLGAGEFSQVKSAVPAADDLIASAPKPGGLGGALGGLASAFGGGIGQLGNLAALAEGFKGLNMDSGMVGKFIPIVLSFVQAKGGGGVKDLLEKVLK
jgi:hypothetical protein